VLYGTDYPFRDGAEVNQGIVDWGFSAADLRAIEFENARKLLPGLKPA
jgi:predicted TIM-barrel fold metal-dependent hydrolase